MTAAEKHKVLAQPTISVEMAGKILGLGRMNSYRCAKAGEIPTIKFGRRLHVPTAKLRQMLGIEPPEGA